MLRGSATKTFTLRTPLDGTVGFDLSAPPGTSYRLRVLAGTHALKRRHVLHASASGYTICGARSLTVQVTRQSGSGPFSLAATLP